MARRSTRNCVQSRNCVYTDDASQLSSFQGEIPNIQDAFVPNTPTIDKEYGFILLCGLPMKEGGNWISRTVFESEKCRDIHLEHMISHYPKYEEHIAAKQHKYPYLAVLMNNMKKKSTESANGNDSSTERRGRRVSAERERSRSRSRSRDRDGTNSDKAKWILEFRQRCLIKGNKTFWKTLKRGRGIQVLTRHYAMMELTQILWDKSGHKMLLNVSGECVVYNDRNKGKCFHFKKIHNQRFYELFGFENCIRRGANDETFFMDNIEMWYWFDKLFLHIKWLKTGTDKHGNYLGRSEAALNY